MIDILTLAYMMYDISIIKKSDCFSREIYIQNRIQNGVRVFSNKLFLFQA